MVERVSTLCRVDASGVAHAAVAYPSILEIWPAVYSMFSIKAIEVRVFWSPGVRRDDTELE